MSAKKTLKLLLHLSNIVLKIALIYLVAGYAYRTLADEDDFYQQRGVNEFCQKTDRTIHSPIDQSVCSMHKYKKFIYLYLDSFPFDLFEYDNQFTGSHSKSFLIRHYGITDSGPVFSSFATGKISNKYEGSIIGIDNIFQQFKNAEYRIRALGYYYPIYEMVGTTFFDSYENSKHGLHNAYCPDFIDLNNVDIPDLSITDSLIFDQAEYFEYFNKRYQHFKKFLKPKRKAIFECLNQHFDNDLSHFMYDVYTDTIGHQFSRQSMFYLNKIAALKANLDILLRFIRDNQEDTLLMILSDHGVVSSLWETEISNHGTAENGNESFLFLFNRKLNKSTFNDIGKINSYDVAPIFAQLIKNVNFPINYKHMPPMIWQNAFNQLATLRQKEAQILLYMKTFPQSTLDKYGIDLEALAQSNALSQVEKLFEIKSMNDQDISELVVQKYQQHIEQLNELYQSLLKTQRSDKWLPAFLLHLAIIVFFILVSFLLLWHKMKTQVTKLGIAVGIFVSLPIIFLLLARVVENMFVGYNFVIMALCLLILTFIDKIFELADEFRYKISILLFVHLLLYGLDLIVDYNSFFFFYYQNLGLQFVLCILLIVWSILLLKQFLTVNGKGFFNKNVRLAFIGLYFIIDLLIITYEAKLMSSFNYFQNSFMITVSRLFYVSFVFLIILHFNFYHKREQIAFILVLKLVFWFGHNYIRVAYYGILVPAYYIYLQCQKNAKIKDTASTKETRLLRKVFDYGLLLYHALFVFYITRGRLDTNISVRVGNRNWGAHIEEIPVFTAIVFSINKFLPFIVSYFLILIFSKKLKDIRPKLRSITKTFNCHLSTIGMRLTDIWFGCAILIYLNTFDDPENQRSSFMLYSSGLIMIIIFYAFAVIDSILSVIKKRAKLKYIPVQTSN